MPEERQNPPQDNPAPARSEYLLEPEEKEPSDYLLPVALGVGGAALLYKAFWGKKDKKKAKAAPEADRDQVSFSDDYSSYKVGGEWVGMVLEPYLAEQAEEGNLLVTDATGLKADHPTMTKSRGEVLTTFFATHRVKLPKGEVLISELSPDRKKVEEFQDFVNTETEKFQETY